MRLQGRERSALATRGDDLYETPPEAVRALLRVEPLPQRIWEPCAGRGAIVRELAAAGHEVCAMDLVAYEGADPGIESGIDFLMEHRAPPGFACIVTNPPFKLADAFIRHGLTARSAGYRAATPGGARGRWTLRPHRPSSAPCLARASSVCR